MAEARQQRAPEVCSARGVRKQNIFKLKTTGANFKEPRLGHFVLFLF